MGLGFYAISKLALATATTLEYTAPIFMVVYLAVIGHHRPSRLEPRHSRGVVRRPIVL